jgi:hypothetical protein
MMNEASVAIGEIRAEVSGLNKSLKLSEYLLG